MKFDYAAVNKGLGKWKGTFTGEAGQETQKTIPTIYTINRS